MPKTIRVIRAVLLLQIVVSLFLIAAAIISVSHKADAGFWRGFQDSLATASGASSLADYGHYHAGRLSGGAFVSLLLLGISRWSVQSRRLWPVVVCTVLLILITLGQGSLPILPVVILSLVCAAPARRWLKREMVPPPLT